MVTSKNEKIILNPGDLFIIDDISIKGDKWKLEDGKRIGKVIYLSNYFKEMMGILFSKKTFQNIDEIKSLENYDNLEYDNLVLYTPYDIIDNDKYYSLIGHNSLVSDDEIELTRRRVANHIYLLDETIKMCDDEDYTKYYSQGYGGYASIVNILNNLETYKKNLYPKNHPLHID